MARKTAKNTAKRQAIAKKILGLTLPGKPGSGKLSGGKSGRKPSAKGVQDRKATLALAFLRIAAGGFFLYQGYTKYHDPAFIPNLAGLLEAWSINNPWFFYQDFLKAVIIPAVDAVARIVIYGELLAGGLLILGLFTATGSALAFFLALNYLLAMGHTSPDALVVNATFLVLTATFYWSRAGEHYGIDALFTPKPKAPAKKRQSALSKRKPEPEDDDEEDDMDD